MIEVTTGYGEFWINSRRKAWAAVIDGKPLRINMDHPAPGAVRAFANAERAERAAWKYLRETV